MIPEITSIIISFFWLKTLYLTLSLGKLDYKRDLINM